MTPLAPLKDQKGMALLITLSVMAVLLAVSFEINRRVARQLDQQQRYLDRNLLMETAEKGLALAKIILVEDARKNPTDSVQEPWADAEKRAARARAVSPESPHLGLTITDEMGKIQINALVKTFPGHEINVEQRQIWETFLPMVLSPDHGPGEDVEALINSLKDWMDNGDDGMITGISGTESGYYQSLDPPYASADQPLFHLDQLFRIRGFSRGMFTRGEGGAPATGDPSRWITVFGAQSAAPGQYVYPGKININTAPLTVVAALLPPGKRDAARRIIDHRRERSRNSFAHDLSVKNWFAPLAGLSKKETAAMEKTITYASWIFSIRSRAEHRGRSLTLTTVVERRRNKDGAWECNTLSQKRE